MARVIDSKYGRYEIRFDGGELLVKKKSEDHDICAFGGDGVDKLRRVLGVGMGDCDHCDEAKVDKRVDALVGTVSGELETIRKRLNSLELSRLGHKNRLDALDVQWEKFSKILGQHEVEINTSPLYDFTKRVRLLEGRMENVDSWGTRLGVRIATIEEDIGLMKFIDAYARGRKTLDDLQNGKDETKQS